MPRTNDTGYDVVVGPDADGQFHLVGAGEDFGDVSAPRHAEPVDPGVRDDNEAVPQDSTDDTGTAFAAALTAALADQNSPAATPAARHADTAATGGNAPAGPGPDVPPAPSPAATPAPTASDLTAAPTPKGN